jgi:hypothetical protein
VDTTLRVRRLARSTAVTAAITSAALAAAAALATTSAQAAGPAPCGTFTSQTVYPTQQSGLVTWDTNTKALGRPRLQVRGTLSDAANCSAQTDLSVTFQDSDNTTGWGPWAHSTPVYRTIALTGTHSEFPFKANMKVPINFDYTDWHSNLTAIYNVILKVCSAYPGHGQHCAAKSVPGQSSPNRWEALMGTTALSGVWGPYTPRNLPFTVSTPAPALPRPARPKPVAPVLTTNPAPVAAKPSLHLTGVPPTCAAAGGSAGASATATLQSDGSVVWNTVSLTSTSSNAHFRVDLLVPPTATVGNWREVGAWPGFTSPTKQPFALNHPESAPIGSKLYVAASFPDGSRCGLSVVSSVQ